MSCSNEMNNLIDQCANLKLFYIHSPKKNPYEVSNNSELFKIIQCDHYNR